MVNLSITNTDGLNEVILRCYLRSCVLEIHELKDFALPSNTAAAS